jgi:hypothetical protein
MPKYTVTGVPAGAQLSAFLPHWDRYAASGAVQYKHTVTGQPGTMGIPAPTTNTQLHPDPGDIAQMGGARSSDAPDVWYPNQYYERSLNGGGTMGPVTPVAIYSTNLMPVPATDARGRPALLAKPIPQRGRTQIGQPRVIPTWGPGG